MHGGEDQLLVPLHRSLLQDGWWIRNDDLSFSSLCDLNIEKRVPVPEILTIIFLLFLLLKGTIWFFSSFKPI